MSKAIDTEIPALRTRIRNLEKALDAQTKLVLEMTGKAAEVVAELRACQKRAAIIAEDNDNDPFRLGRESAWGNAADLVAEKLGVK